MRPPATLTLDGPGIAPVTRNAVDLYRAVLDGRWSAVVDHTADMLNDPDAARVDLDALADGHQVDHDPMTVEGEGGTVRFTGPEPDLCAALDLLSRVLAGQWRQIAYTAGRFGLGRDCDRIRYRHQRAWGYPAHPGAYLSLHACPAASIVAYDGWKALGGGMRERGFAGAGVTVTRVSDLTTH